MIEEQEEYIQNKHRYSHFFISTLNMCFTCFHILASLCTFDAYCFHSRLFPIFSSLGELKITHSNKKKKFNRARTTSCCMILTFAVNLMVLELNMLCVSVRVHTNAISDAISFIWKKKWVLMFRLNNTNKFVAKLTWLHLASMHHAPIFLCQHNFGIFKFNVFFVCSLS